jgi:hypothetical protein
MKWRLKFLWSKARPLTTFFILMAVPFLPVVPWVLAAGPEPEPMAAAGAHPEVISLSQPIPTGAAERGESSFRGPPPPLDPAAIRKAARKWEVKPIDGSGWKLLMTNRFAVRGDLLNDDLRAVGAFAERFLDSVHERLKGDLTDLRLSIRVFAQEPEFLDWASCHHVEAAEWFYDPHAAEIVLLFSGATDVSKFCGHLMRGVTLEYFDRALEYQGPSRVAESVAEWLADYEVLKGIVSPRRKRGDVSSWLRIAEPEKLESAWKAWSEAGPLPGITEKAGPPRRSPAKAGLSRRSPAKADP